MNSATAENTYDVIVIGAGPIGLTLADRARAAGLSVAVVERELVSGVCSYWARIPSKACAAPDFFEAARLAADDATQIAMRVDVPGV